MGRDHGDRGDRRHGEGWHLPADADRSRPPGARLVQGARRGAWLHASRSTTWAPCSRGARAADDVPPIAMGSHLDTQPTGGKFDGVLGVLAALEALRTLHEAGYETYAPIEVVNWTNEEGRVLRRRWCRPACLPACSRATGRMSRADRDGVTFGAALDAIGYRGPRALRRASAVGILRTAYRAGADPGGREQRHRHRHRRAGDALVRGDDDRPGRAHRRDADAAAQECAARRRANGRARSMRSPRRTRRAVGTVGLMEVKPDSPNVVPGEVFFSVDLRHPDAAVLDEMERRSPPRAGEGKLGLDVVMKTISDPAGGARSTRTASRRCGRRRSFPAIRRATWSRARATTRQYRARRAGRDDLRAVPDGISHNEAEYSSKEQCAPARRSACRPCSITTARLSERGGTAKGAR